MGMAEKLSTLRELGQQLHEAKQELREILMAAEDHLADVYVYPAWIPIKVAREEYGRTRQQEIRLHFNGENLRYEGVFESFSKPRARVVGRCLSCGKDCAACAKKRERVVQESRKRWEARMADWTQTRDVLDCEDSAVLCAVVGALPQLRQRLIDDAKVSPEEIQEAVEGAQQFLLELKSRRL